MRTSFAILAALAALAFAAAPASAEIVVNKSVAGVELGMSQQTVLDLIGDPDTTITNAALDTTYTYRSRGIKVVFAPNGDTNDVTSVTVYRKGEATASGVGLGSTLKALRAGVPKLRCERAPNRKQLWCGVNTRRRHTTFVVTSTKKVRQIVFGYRGD
jgi:outer membrane protein assembly factor BamE (lipoprotein component of BamABCDE complex)